VANASVDKLKDLGLRHGEKAVMGLTAALCVFFLFQGATRETIDLTPEQVKDAASAAESNLNRKQEPADILKLIEDAGIKNPGFTTIVEEQETNLLVADAFRPHQRWVSPEPGAGLIRDMPELIAVAELIAYPGRGGVLVYALDENGNRVPEEADKVEDAETKARRERKAGGGRSAKARMSEARKKEEEEKARKEEEKRKISALAGGIAKKDEAPAEGATEAAASKEITKGVRWVALTGVLDYQKLRDNYLTALKRPEVAYPHFKQLDVERQTRQSDGTWSEWEPLDLERNRLVLDNLPEVDEEWTPDTVRISELVAPLPFLKAGYWERVHVARMVPEEKFKVAAAPAGNFGGPEGGNVNAPVENLVTDVPTTDTGGYVAGNGTGMEGMYAGSSESINFEKTEEKEIMVRALDFTVEPDATYRFRVRLVVYNPNLNREDVSPGVDTKSVELFGPWSEPTEEVSMPSDVATYALNKEPLVPRKLDQVKFEVARWTPEDGVTIVKSFTAAPGEIIGEVQSADLPMLDSSGKRAVSKKIDFNSHQLVLDVMGGDQPIPALGPGTAGKLPVPAISLVVRPDGTVVVRNQANDLHDQVRKDMESNYKRGLKDLEKKKSESRGSTDAAMP
jgi:hypothetical protein